MVGGAISHANYANFSQSKGGLTINKPSAAVFAFGLEIGRKNPGSLIESNVVFSSFLEL